MSSEESNIRHWLDSHEGLLAADGQAPTQTWKLDVQGLRTDVETMLSEAARLRKREATLKKIEDAYNDPLMDSEDVANLVHDIHKGRA